MANPTRFHISYDRGAYYVSIPNYAGGEVVDADSYERLLAELILARARIEYLGAACNDPRHFEHNAKAVLPRISAVINDAVSAAKVTGE